MIGEAGTEWFIPHVNGRLIPQTIQMINELMDKNDEDLIQYLQAIRKQPTSWPSWRRIHIAWTVLVHGQV